MTVFVDVVGTESFFDQPSGGNSRLDSIASWCDNVWTGDIQDGSGDYYANFTARDASTVEVPESALCDSCTLGDRRADADVWLYDIADAIIAVDYASGLGMGHAGGGSTAGDAWDITCIANVDRESKNVLPDEWKDVGTEGIAAHELGHLFDGDHGDAATVDGGSTSLMYGSDSNVNCFSVDDVTKVIDWYSSCTRSDVRSHVDANL